MTVHAGVRSCLEVDGTVVVEGYCSCRHVTDRHPADPGGKLKAAGELLTHLRNCPDEVDGVDVSLETEAWAERHYNDRTCTLDEWRARYG